MRIALALSLLGVVCGCSDYGLAGQGEDAVLPPDRPDLDDPTPEPTPEPTPGDDDSTDGDPIDEEPPTPPPCSETIQADWSWWGNQPFGEAADPSDAWGRPFWASDFDMVGWSTVSMPDSGHSPPGTDRAYRTTFDLQQLPPTLLLSMQSDDGMAFWLNGQLVGQWGGLWQEEGCVNDDANCQTFELVEPVDITDLLVFGTNTAAARVSNPVMNAFFDVYTSCVDG